ncbi:hypothetical protein Pelo_15523 [Pelomyxa schiedti]|nr:hypothetical protein Pelo_15523 [Pelomyxa schiedti]
MSFSAFSSRGRTQQVDCGDKDTTAVARRVIAGGCYLDNSDVAWIATNAPSLGGGAERPPGVTPEAAARAAGRLESMVTWDCVWCFLNAEEQARKARPPGEANGDGEAKVTMQIVGGLLESGSAKKGGIPGYEHTLYQCMEKCPDEVLLKKILNMAGHTKVPMHWLAKNARLIDSAISMGVQVSPKAESDLADPQDPRKKIRLPSTESLAFSILDQIKKDNKISYGSDQWTALSNAILDEVQIGFWDTIVGCPSQDRGLILTILNYAQSHGGIKERNGKSVYSCVAKWGSPEVISKALEIENLDKVPLHWLLAYDGTVPSEFYLSKGVKYIEKAIFDLAGEGRLPEKSTAEAIAPGILCRFINQVDLFQYLAEMFPVKANWSFLGACSSLKAFEVVNAHISKHGFEREGDPGTAVSTAAASHDQAFFKAVLNFLTADERGKIDWFDLFFQAPDPETANVILLEAGILPTDRAEVRKLMKTCVSKMEYDRPPAFMSEMFRKWFVSAVSSGAGTIGGFLYGHRKPLHPLYFALDLEDLELTRMLLAAGVTPNILRDSGGYERCINTPLRCVRKSTKQVEFCKILLDAGYQPLASDLHNAIKHHNLELVKVLAHQKSIWLPGQVWANPIYSALLCKNRSVTIEVLKAAASIPNLHYSVANCLNSFRMCWEKKEEQTALALAMKRDMRRKGNWTLSQLLVQIPNIDPFNCCGHLCGETLLKVAQSEELSKVLFPKVPGPIMFGYVVPAVLEAVKNNNITFVTAVADASGPSKFQQYVGVLPIDPKTLAPEMVSFLASRGCGPAFSAASKVGATEATTATAEADDEDDHLEAYFAELPTRVPSISMQLPDGFPSEIEDQSGAESSE